MLASADRHRFDDGKHPGAFLEREPFERAARDAGDQPRVVERELHIGIGALLLDRGDEDGKNVVGADAVGTDKRQHHVLRIYPYTDDIVRIRIDAQDVMLALVRPDGVSANNILPVLITAIKEEGANADVQLALNDARLVARITRRSLERLALKEGARVFAVIKSVTVGGREHG